MKKGLRNLALITGLAIPLVGLKSLKSYNEYRTPEIVSVEDEGKFRVTTYRYESHPLFENIDKLLGREINHDSYTRGAESGIDLTGVEEEAATISKNWSYYKSNDSRPMEDSEWDKQRQAVYNALNGVEEGKINSEYSNEMKMAIALHERFHRENSLSPENIRKTKLEKELEAYAYSLIYHPIVLDDLEGLRKNDSESTNREAANIILERLYGNNSWDFYHAPNFKKNLRKKSEEIFNSLRKK